MQALMEKRKFSKEMKLQIIKEASEQGVTNTLEKQVFIRPRSTVGKRSLIRWAKMVFDTVLPQPK